MNEKKKEKISKKALKALCKNDYVVGKLKEVFGMQEHDDEDVVKVFKKCVRSYLEDNSEESEWENAFKKRNKSKAEDDYDEDTPTGTVEIDQNDRTKVRRRSRNSEIVSQFSSLLNR